MVFIKKLLRIVISVVIVCSVSNVYAMKKTLVKDKHRFQKNKKNRSDDNKLVKQINDLLENVRMIPINYQKHGERPNLLKLQQDQNFIESNLKCQYVSYKVKRNFTLAKCTIKMIEQVTQELSDQKMVVCKRKNNNDERSVKKNKNAELCAEYDIDLIYQRSRSIFQDFEKNGALDENAQLELAKLSKLAELSNK